LRSDADSVALASSRELCILDLNNKSERLRDFVSGIKLLYVPDVSGIAPFASEPLHSEPNNTASSPFVSLVGSTKNLEHLTLNMPIVGHLHVQH